MSKLQSAIDIVKSFEGDKKDLLILIESSLGVTRANASVYLFKANKAIAAGTAPAKKSKAKKAEAVVESTPVEYDITDEDQLAYQEAMAERKTAGLSTMSIQEWKEMSENLKALA